MLREPIIYGNFPNGQSSLGKMEQGKFFSLTNCDIHSEAGLAKPQLALVSESTTPNEDCFSAIVTHQAMYIFVLKTTGKIWKRAIADASYSLVNTNTNTAHRGCRYFNGYLWYWTATKLGHYNLDATWTDTFATFANGNARGSLEHANALYIGDGKNIARVDSANAFSDDEFVVPAQYKITEMISVGDDILIGTYVGTDVSYFKVFLWDTVSPSWTYEDEVFEIGLNCFMRLDNIVVAQCGTTGRFYYWTGSQMNYLGKINGITTALGEQMTCTYKGRPLFANATKIYSLHKEDRDLPLAFCGEYTATGTISSIIVQGQQLLVSRGTGVDKVGTTYATATLETPEAQYPITNVKISYDAYPAGIGLFVKTNGGTYAEKTAITDSDKMEITFNGGLPSNANAQVKVVLTPSGSDIPKIKKIILN
jgi:hypothetical protein